MNRCDFCVQQILIASYLGLKTFNNTTLPNTLFNAYQASDYSNPLTKLLVNLPNHSFLHQHLLSLEIRLMDRKEFLSLLGFSSASLALGSCLEGCSKNVSSGTTAPNNVDFTLDLSQPANAALLTNGSYVYNSGVLVARTTKGAYIAVRQVCTHENVSVIYQGNNQRFYCSGHGATFNEAGAVLGGPAPRALKTYNTSLTANSPRVYS